MFASHCIDDFPLSLFRMVDICWPLLFLQLSLMSSLKLAQSALRKLKEVLCGVVCDEVTGDG